MEKKIKYINARATTYTIDLIETYKKIIFDKFKVKLTTSDVVMIAIQRLMDSKSV